MRIALCFSAHLRQYERYFPNIKEKFLQLSTGGQIDVFIHTWRKRGPTHSWHVSHNGTEGMDLMDIDIEHVKQLYNPTIIAVENYEDIKPILLLKNFTDKTPGNEHIYKEGICTTTPAFYKIWRCNELKKEYEQTHNFVYDMVIRLRPDMNYSYRTMTLDIRNHVHVPHIMEDQCYDHLAISNSKFMDQYSSCFLNLHKIYQQDFDLGGEKTLYRHLQLQGLSFTSIPHCSITK